MFKISRMLVGGENMPSVVYVPATASETFSEGEAVMLSSGAVTKATSKPKYIIAGEVKGGIAPCYLVTPYVVFETTCASSPEDFLIGDKLTLSSDAMEVDDESTSGVATVFEKHGEGVGSAIEILFE